jgi:hypothetical protein
MAEWSKDHIATIGFLNSNCGLINGSWLKWRPGGPLGERGDSWLERLGVGTWQTGTSKVVAPACVD